VIQLAKNQFKKNNQSMRMKTYVRRDTSTMQMSSLALDGVEFPKTVTRPLSPLAPGTGGSGVPRDSNVAATAAIDTGGSEMPPDEAIQRAQPFLFDLPMFMSEETHLQHDTTQPTKMRTATKPHLLARMGKMIKFSREPPL
jgi:hypothetical protein